MALSDRRPPGEDRHGERGFVLAIVLVFLVVLGISAVAASRVTRTNTQVIHNIRNEKIAFYTGEAGVTEALLRVGMLTSTPVTVNGRTFDARITPKSVDPNWRALILSGSFDPSTTGSLFRAPTIQPTAGTLPYLTAADGVEALSVRWALSGGSILRVAGKPVLQVQSTGREGAARRRITVQAIYNGPLSTIVLDPLACSGVLGQGGVNLAFPGGVHVNSTCSDGIKAGGSGQITSDGAIDVVGGSSGSISPTPTTGASILPDPLATLLPPSFLGVPVRNGSALLPSTLTTSGTVTLQPGIYYGGIELKAQANVTLQPGVYILAGGGLKLGGGSSITGAGVMFYNTLDPVNPTGAGAFGAIDLNTNGTVSLSAPTSGTYASMIFFQDRLNTKPLKIWANTNGLIDGVIYAANAQLQLGGGADLIESQLVVGSLSAGGNATIGMPTNPLQIGKEAVTRIAWQDW